MQIKLLNVVSSALVMAQNDAFRDDLCRVAELVAKNDPEFILKVMIFFSLSYQFFMSIKFENQPADSPVRAPSAAAAHGGERIARVRGTQ